MSMGGTLCTLNDPGRDVHIAYMTSGNIAVFDHDALRHIDYVSEFHKIFGLNNEPAQALCQKLCDAISTKQSGDFDTEDVLNVKSLIRKTEATAAAMSVGVSEEKLHFLELPFYRTGKVSKRPICDADVAIIAKLLRELRPGQIYVAGDLSDPHGTHRVCAQAMIRAAWKSVKPGGGRPRSLALPRRLAGIRTARDRTGRPLEPGGHAAKETGHLQARIPEGQKPSSPDTTSGNSGFGPKNGPRKRPASTTTWGFPRYYGLEGLRAAFQGSSDGRPKVEVRELRDSSSQNDPNHLEVLAESGSGAAWSVRAVIRGFWGDIGPPSLNGWRDHGQIGTS